MKYTEIREMQFIVLMSFNEELNLTHAMDPTLKHAVVPPPFPFFAGFLFLFLMCFDVLQLSHAQLVWYIMHIFAYNIIVFFSISEGNIFT